MAQQSRRRLQVNLLETDQKVLEELKELFGDQVNAVTVRKALRLALSISRRASEGWIIECHKGNERIQIDIIL